MDFLTKLDNLAWGVPMLILIMGTGLLLTVRLGVLQFRKLGLALRYMVKKRKRRCGRGYKLRSAVHGAVGYSRYR